MCFVCEDENNYDYSIISYDEGKRITHQFAIRYYEESDEFILFVRSDDEADMQILPINYCPFCGTKLH